MAVTPSIFDQFLGIEMYNFIQPTIAPFEFLLIFFVVLSFSFIFPKK